MMCAELPSLLQSFFTDRLLQQKRASPHTIAGYRDCFRLLLHFAKERLGKPPSKILIEDLDAPFLGQFFEHLESVRKNSARTRNVRLAAIHSFFQYIAFEERISRSYESKRSGAEDVQVLGLLLHTVR
jgi:site-specific recombinase XerD